MAIIGRIRKRVGLLIGFVGASMILFILGDLVTSNTGLMKSNSDVIGKIGGDKIHYQEFEKRYETLLENFKKNQKKDNVDPSSQEMIREQTWGMFINDKILAKEYEKIGISCSAQELYDMCTGKNPHQQVKQAFTDPKTGSFDPATVVRFLKDLPNREENIQREWRTFEDAIKEERISEKFKNIVKFGINVTAEEAKRNYEETARSASIRFVRLDYNTIADTAVKFEESDLNSYYENNKYKYKQAETIRKVEYITFDVMPSAEDRSLAQNWINSKKDEFASSPNGIVYVNQNSDTPFDSSYHAKGTLSSLVDSLLFNAPMGTVAGPYEENSSLTVARLVGEKMISDSVKARHILIKIENNDSTKALAKADSLKNAIKKGSNFEMLAMMFSQDPGSGSKGGDLGWFRPGMMVKEFNDACFDGKVGDMPIVTSQFGVHLIEITAKGPSTRQIQVAYLQRKIEPSQKTYDQLYNKASEFAIKNTTGEAFDSSIVKQGLNKRIADNIRENDKNVPGLEQPRELVRWAYAAKKNDVSKVFTFGDKYVIAHLTDIKDKGYLPLDYVKEQVTAEVRKIKKGELLAEKITNAGGGSIDAIAQKLNVTAADADNINFTNGYAAGIGNEPKVIGAIFSTKPNQLTKPIIGDNGVTIVLVKSINEGVTTKDFSANIKQITDQRKSRSDYELFNALKEKANIEDNRGKFY